MATAIIRCKCSIRGLYNFQHLLLFSTKSPNQSIKSPNQSYTDYLVNNLGFSHQQALSISTKIRSNVSIFKFCNNANNVVAFLKQHGFDDTHIIKLVSSRPAILVAKVDKTLIPKFKLLQDYGFSGSNLVSVISTNPSFLLKHMNRIFHDLRVVLGSDENLTKLLRKSNAFTTTPALENLVSNVALLNNEYGVDIHVIRNGILQQSGSFLRKPEFFRKVLDRVEEELGIPRNSGMFLYGLHLLACSSKERIQSQCQAFRSFGWTEYDVSELMRRSPNALVISEENIRKKLGFLMTELGYKPEYLATHAALLGYSIEKRMAPRHRVLSVLKEKGLLDYNFYTAVVKTEKQFLKIFIEPFKENAPGLLELYQSSKGSSNIDAIPSLEKRMEPRHRVLMVLKEKDLLDYNFYTAISKTETQFLKTFIEPFEEDVPGLLELYQKSKGCSNVDSISG